MPPDHPLPTLRQTIAAHGLMPKKALGQHFLLDERLLDRIAGAAGTLSGCHVVEIGPGPGGLTRALLRAGAHVYAVEKDARCIAALKELEAAYPGKLRIVEADALTVDPTALAPAPRKIVANLPYNIGTALLVRWLELVWRQGREAFDNMTLMFQKEVAMRIAAPPGGKEYGRLSVMAQWLCEVTPCFAVPAGAFWPPPKVDSAVIRLMPRSQPLFQADKPALEKILASAFGQRRKMLRSALKPLGGEELLRKADIDPTRRAEELSVEEFCRIARCL